MEKKDGNEAIINTDALKTKAGNLVDKAKGGVLYYKDNIKKDKRLMIGTGVVVFLIILLIVLATRDGSKVVAEKFAKGIAEQDAELYEGLYHENYLDEIDDYIDGDLVDYMEEYFEDEFEEYEIESYEITRVKDVDEDDLEDWAEELDDEFDIEEKSVKAAKIYTIKFEVEYDGEDESYKIKLPVVKVGGKWYVFNLPDDLI